MVLELLCAAWGQAANACLAPRTPLAAASPPLTSGSPRPRPQRWKMTDPQATVKRRPRLLKVAGCSAPSGTCWIKRCFLDGEEGASSWPPPPCPLRPPAAAPRGPRSCGGLRCRWKHRRARATRLLVRACRLGALGDPRPTHRLRWRGRRATWSRRRGYVGGGGGGRRQGGPAAQACTTPADHNQTIADVHGTARSARYSPFHTGMLSA
mmetsp:Transcript_61062/g.197424  ORF Transcript_61062/g.197424 Transcript_61062/m.197424 type:complete len:209 (-) Transcript_61062:55-681(-)